MIKLTRAQARKVLDWLTFARSRAFSYIISRCTRSKADLNLLISLYPEQDEARLQELQFCLNKNLECRHIQKIYIFFENQIQSRFVIPNNPKIEIIEIKSRPTFKIYFDFADKYLKGQIVAIANSDIFFDFTLVRLCKYNLKNKVLALTRYNYRPYPDHLGRTWKRYGGSQDVWIFSPPLKPFNSEIYPGWLGCDGYLAREVEKAGIKILNPSLTLMTWHVHKIARLTNAGDYHQIKDASGKLLERIHVPITYL